LSVLGITAGKVTHQVQNFLNNISFGLSNLKMSELSSTSKKSIEVMERNKSNLEDFIRSYLAFAKKPEMKVAASDLRVDLETLVHTYGLKQLNIRLDYDPSENGNFSIECDSAQLGEAFSCILQNSLEAQNGQGIVHITLKDLKDKVELIFKDNGPGLESDVQERIFEPFFTTKGKKGTGLGLSLVKNIIEAHSGTITVESAPGKGIRFIIQLPKRFAVDTLAQKNGGIS